MTTFQHFAPTSRIWIYQANRAFSANEIREIQILTHSFVEGWAAHGRDLTAAGTVLHDRFLVLVVDEARAGASGCSIDASVGFVRELQTKYNVDLLDRMVFAFCDDKGAVQTASRAAFAQLYAMGAIDDDTIVFDTLVPTLADLQSRFEVPLAQSWHRRMVHIGN
jgi:hypothetical protein